MSKKINIRGKEENKDPFYRYKMEQMILIREKNGTCIKNFINISKDLDRDPKIIISYFKKKLGTNIIFNSKTGEAKISKELNLNTLEEILFAFIDKNILCITCNNPETKIEDKKMICKSCGSSNYLK
jgi:translation initiation factor 5